LTWNRMKENNRETCQASFGASFDSFDWTLVRLRFRRVSASNGVRSLCGLPCSVGTPLEPRNLERAYKQILAIAGLHHIRIHGLRHTAATLLLTQGVHQRVVMDLLGHSQIAITMNLYSHVVPALRKEAAEQMDAALKPHSEPVATSVATKPSSLALN
jgi:integrase